ncbi:hypothetical protein Tco_1314439 [Tanacetum coccineum]
MILEGSELTKDDRESQLYDEFEHFRQIKGETIQGYYVRFTKLINDMRNIKMTMPRMQLNSKFVNNMLPEWSRFITEVKLNRGLKESNFDQLYAYLKQHEVHANENRTMMERFLQPTNDPLALVSNASVQQYPTQSSKSPQSSNEPSPADNFQLDSGSSSTENLIESLSNSLALLTQSYKSHLPQTNNQLRTSSNARNKATVQDGRVVVQDVRGRYNANNQGRSFQRNNARGNVVAGNVGGQNRGGIINPDSDYFKDKMLLMQAQENGAVLDEEQSLFLAGEQVTNFDDDVDDSPENDLALNTMFMVNLSSEDPIYDEAGPSHDSNTPFEVQDHDTFVDHMDEYHEVHEMQNDVQHNYVVDSNAEYTSDSNIIPYNQYLEDNEENGVQSNVSSVQNDALMSIINEMHEEGVQQGVQSRLANKPDKVVNDSLTSELARYKELVGEYEKRAKFELTDRERKIDEQMRIIISDRNRKETSLKSELHSVQILLSSTVGHYKSKTEEVTILKKDFKQKEDKFLEEFLDIKRLKEKVEDRLYKQDQSVQTVHMLCKPKSFYDEKNKVAIGYKNPLYLTRAKQAHSALYNGHVLVTTNHTPTVVHDSEDTREIAKITRKGMLLKMQSPLCVENKEAPDFNSFFKIKNLEHQIQEKDNVIRDLKVLVSNVNDRSCEPYNANDVTDLLEQNERFRAEIEKVTATSIKELYDSIKITRVHTREKTSTMLNEIESLKAQLKSKVSCVTSDSVKPKVLAPGMYAIVVKPIPHTLRTFRSKNSSTEASGSKPRSNTKKNRILPAKTENKKKVEDHPRTNNHEMCVVNILNSVNATPTVKIVLNKGKQIWKPKGKLSDNSLNKTKQVWKATGKLFANVGYQWDSTGKKSCPLLSLGKLNCGYQWRPTGKKFALGELCPLTKLSVQCRTVILWISGLGLFKKYDGESSKLRLCGKCGSPEYTTSEGLGDSTLFSVGHFVISDLVVAFRKHLLLFFKPDLTFFRVFGALCYPTNDSENLGKFQAKADIGIFVGYAPSRKGYRIYNKRTRRLMETIHVTFDEMHETMAHVRMSSGPEPIIMTPRQLKLGFAPTDKELEMLFQPMFDEHLEQSRVNEPVPSATEINAQVVPPGTSLSTTIAQDAPSISASSSTSDMHHPVQHQVIAEEPTHEDPPINHDVLHPSHNLVIGDPGSAQSSSRNVNSAEPNHVNYCRIPINTSLCNTQHETRN